VGAESAYAAVPEEFSAGPVHGLRISTEHLDDLCEMHADATVMATLGGIRDRETTRRYVEVNCEHWDRRRFGIYVLRDIDDGGLVGRAGLRHVHVGGHDEIEVAYGLRSEFWGRGIAAAVTEELVRIATDAGLCAELVAFTQSTNRRSWRVMEKTGFVFERKFDHEGSSHVLYRRFLNVR
jgi:[ribosomal protein S5]-alanine N-acetyltransferase